MAAIRGRDTTPEVTLRHFLHSMGYRYRKHVRDLPGHPDLVFPGRRKIVEVRGCFWHRHQGCVNAVLPKSRAAWWAAKFAATVERDVNNLAALGATGWQVLVIWECEIRKDAGVAAGKVAAFLGPPGRLRRNCYRGASESGGLG